MLVYFPFAEANYKMSLGAQALNPDRLLEIDLAHYQAEISLKQAILASDYPAYFQAYPTSELLQWEAIELLLPNLVRHYPDYFSLQTKNNQWSWRNQLLNQFWEFELGDSTTLPYAPLDWLGRQVQEDLLILDGKAAGIPLVAGQLCFANAWTLTEKMGKSFLDIHAEVPLFKAQIGQSSYQMMERLKANRPVWRLNWSIKHSDQLNLATPLNERLKVSIPEITSQNAGERCFFRIERQGFLRLPRSNSALFTIHTYQTRLKALLEAKEQARLVLGVLKTAPAAILEYKGIAPFAAPLTAYLEAELEDKSEV